MKLLEPQQHLYRRTWTSLCRLVSLASGTFRKRPSKTFGGLRLKTATDAVQKSSIFTIHYSTLSIRERLVVYGICYKYSQVSAYTKNPVSPLGCLPSLLRLLILFFSTRDKASNRQRQHQRAISLVTQAKSSRGLFERVAAAKDNGRRPN